MKKKIIIVLSAFTAGILAFGAYTVVFNPTTYADNSKSNYSKNENVITLNSIASPEEIAIASIAEPNCGEEEASLENCFPIILAKSFSKNVSKNSSSKQNSNQNKSTQNSTSQNSTAQNKTNPTTTTAPTSPTTTTTTNTTNTGTSSATSNNTNTSNTSTPTNTATTNTNTNSSSASNATNTNTNTTPTNSSTNTQTTNTTNNTINNTTPPSNQTNTNNQTNQSASNLKWGAFLPNGTSGISNLEAQVGSSMDILATFVGWGNGTGDFPTWLKSSLVASGKTLLIYWEPAQGGNTGNTNQPNYNYDSIINGNWDSYVTAFAKSAKSYGGEIILIPFDEMNGDWYPWSGTKNGNSPEKHNLAYRHLHDLFSAQNVTNVKWGWAPNSTSWPNTSANDLTKYYPGDSYVDYVGADGFNFYSSGNWETFSQIFDTAIGKLKQYNKPIYIFSMASAETGDGSKKAAWITDALTVQMPKNQIAGFIWFNENKERNWLINSSPASLSAFSSAIQ